MHGRASRAALRTGTSPTRSTCSPPSRSSAGPASATSWTGFGDELDRLLADHDLPPAERLERALAGLLDIGRRRPHAYALMFGPASNASAGAAAAVSRTHDQFLSIVSGVIGDPARARQSGALLMTSVHGVVSMENAGHLGVEKWHATGDQLLRRLIGLLAADRSTGDDA